METEVLDNITTEIPEAVKNPGNSMIPLFQGTPTLGMVRIEWHNALQGTVIPTNFGLGKLTPTGYLVDDAQNLILQAAYNRRAEWLLLLEDDNIAPPDFYVKLRKHFEAKTGPVISGLYYIKGSYPPEPLIYRGRGTGAYRDWKLGDLVWCDGVPTGCIAIHNSVYRPIWEQAEWYVLPSNEGMVKVKRVFNSPREVIWDGNIAHTLVGTSDLQFCDLVIKSKVLKDTPWPHLADEEYPFVVDTSMKFGHIDRDTGEIF